MKAHIEFLEDELQDRAMKCSDQEKKFTQLQNENEMKDVKIEMLEELFRSLNDERHHEEEENSAPASPSLQTLVVEGLVNLSRQQRVSRGNRPSIGKARSWDNLLGKGRKGDSTSIRPTRTNSRPVSSKNLNEEVPPEENRAKSPRSSSGKRKSSLIIVGDQEGAYVGPIVDGKPNGIGTVRFSNGDTFLGEVKDGELNGKGTLYSKSGVSRGSFRNNVFLG